MNVFGLDGFAAVRPVRVELLTARYLVTGTIQTRFSRVAEILNQLTSTHIPVEDCTIQEHGHGATEQAASVIVALDELLLMIADLEAVPRGDMRVPKEPIHAGLAIPPLRVDGTVHVPIGSRPMDGLLNVPERFVPMTDVSVSSASYPELARLASVAAIRRDRAHLILFTDARFDAEGLDRGTPGAGESS